MHVSKEFLMEAFGLSLLVMLILISSGMFRKAMELTSCLEMKQEETLTELEEYDIIRYDGMKVDGMTAIGYIKTAVGEYHLPVRVTTENGSFSVLEKQQFAALREPGAEYYVDPLTMYQCRVERDENGSFAEIEICVVMEGD